MRISSESIAFFSDGSIRSEVNFVTGVLSFGHYVNSDFRQGLASLTEVVRVMAIGFCEYNLSLIGSNVLTRISFHNPAFAELFETACDRVGCPVNRQCYDKGSATSVSVDHCIEP